MKRWAIFAALCIASMGVHAQVYRCGNTYTQEPCKGGREVDVTPPVSDLSGPKTTVIYLCRAQGGSFYWIPQRCATRGWTLERSATVSKHVSWENQVELPRVFRRLISLRGLSHEEVEQVLARGP